MVYFKTLDKPSLDDSPSSSPKLMLGILGNCMPLSEPGLTLHTMSEREVPVLATPSCGTWTAAAAAACKGELADGIEVVAAAAAAAVEAS